MRLCLYEPHMKYKRPRVNILGVRAHSDLGEGRGDFLTRTNNTMAKCARVEFER